LYLWHAGKGLRRPPRHIKAGARIVYHARYWQVHIASAFSLRHHYRAILGW